MQPTSDSQSGRRSELHRVCSILTDMSFNGYSDAMVNVGGGFLGVLVDLSGSQGRAYSDNVLSLLPVIFVFIILSAVGAMFGFISYSTAILYSFLLFFSLAILQRFLKWRIKQNP